MGFAYNMSFLLASSAALLQTVDEDLVVGGPGLAYWLQTNPQEFPDDKRVSGTYFATQIANSSLPLNFFSFHAVAACTDSAACDIKNVRGGPSLLRAILFKCCISKSRL